MFPLSAFIFFKIANGISITQDSLKCFINKEFFDPKKKTRLVDMSPMPNF